MNYETLAVEYRGQRIHLFQAIGVVSVFGLWELAARYARRVGISEEIMPSLTVVFTESVLSFSRFYDGTSENELVQALSVLATQSMVTVERFFIGVFLGLAIGFLIGLVLSWNPLVWRTFGPVITVARTIPLLALIPLFLLWFGDAEIGKYVYIAYAVAVLFAVNTVEAVSNLQDEYREFARTLGASKLRVYRSVVLRGIVPELIGGMRVIFGMGWAIVLAAEFIATQRGLGYLLIQSQQFFSIGRILIITVIFMSLTLLVNGAFLILARRATAWK